MLSKEDNDLLTRTGPGTPMGTLMRRYWIPALLSEEVPSPESRPVKTMLLGEKLIAFRNTSGKIGLIAEACPHRGASLFYGSREGQGIACPYHGWEFETDGSCVHIPHCPDGEKLREKVKAKTYPCRERGGIVWAYLGEGEPPELPELPMNTGKDSHLLVRPVFSESNWLQNLEASLDISHIRSLHRASVEKMQEIRPASINEDDVVLELLDPTPAQKIEAADTDIGCAFAACEEISPGGKLCWGVGQFLFPFFAMLPFGHLGHHWIHAVVPMDDHHTMIFQMSMSFPFYRPPFSELMYGTGQDYLENTPDWFGRFRPARNPENGFLARWEKKKTQIDGQLVQDLAIAHSMGKIADRSQEHLTSHDIPLIQVRRRLLQALRSQEEFPPGVRHPGAYRAKQGSFVLPKGASWAAHLAKAGG